jgi:hypothetical protein
MNESFSQLMQQLFQQKVSELVLEFHGELEKARNVAANEDMRTALTHAEIVFQGIMRRW